jgi:urea carboxylase-associated protein 2
MTTATPQGAREHARAQVDASAAATVTMPVLPAQSWANPPEDVEAHRLVWAEVVAAGNYTSLTVGRGTTIELTDQLGDACAHVLLYNAELTSERLNVADTTKVQWQAYLTTGSLLLSDLGRVLATVTSDSSAHHDALCGTSTLSGNVARYGDGSPQGPSPAGRELFTLAAAKHGLGRRDVPPSVSFFQGVRVSETGGLGFVGSAGAGASVRLLAELPLTVLIVNTAHPLDPRAEFHNTDLQVLAWRGTATRPGEPNWERNPEGARAYRNTESFLLSRSTDAAGAL